jgi:hypothetical protein
VVSRLPPPTERPVQTRFRFGSGAEHLNLADDGKSPDHYAKGTPSPGGCPHRAPTACRHVVSGSLSSPGRGSSHLSLALLGSLSVAREYLALRDGPRRFEPAFTCRALLRCRTRGVYLPRTGLSPSVVRHSRLVLLDAHLVTLICSVLQPLSDESGRFRLIRVRSPLLTESLLLSFPPGTEMFQFPGLATCTYGFSAGQFGDPGLNTRLTVTPGLSQSSTPFIAFWRQDIPHMPLVAWPH